jgi:hypothetical protein
MLLLVLLCCLMEGTEGVVPRCMTLDVDDTDNFVADDWWMMISVKKTSQSQFLWSSAKADGRVLHICSLLLSRRLVVLRPCAQARMEMKLIDCCSSTIAKNLPGVLQPHPCFSILGDTPQCERLSCRHPRQLPDVPLGQVLKWLGGSFSMTSMYLHAHNTTTHLKIHR